MKACVFGGNLSVLVNGSPTGEINIPRGVWSSHDLNLFKGFSIGSDGPSISHLQYADDTLCIGEASVDNLWSMKVLLRG
jgi:hypothetical protein